MYLAEVLSLPRVELAKLNERYELAWERYVKHCTTIREIDAALDKDGAAAVELWNSIDQPAANEAFTTVIGEREPSPKVNLATMACRHFGLDAVAGPAEGRDRKLRASDNNRAWDVAPNGLCRGCGTPTISHRRYDRLRKLIATGEFGFDTSPNYVQANGKEAPLWSSRTLIAAKGVADHVQPWSQGGSTTDDNLANVCAGCNYSRSDTSLDVVRVTAYT
ncbi:MAG: HNH endonuclease signature motif containing protein [Ilumatobacter fluminis]|uniref:HNH endonuclease signature motif containing protein n=1 Tax=Ilumatobacter fluminis TaxID=467091 RepID=UPI0032EBACD1